MRQCIADQATTAVAANPALLGEIYRIRTPQQIEMILTQLNIDIDTPASAQIKSFIVEFGGDFSDASYIN